MKTIIQTPTTKITCNDSARSKQIADALGKKKCEPKSYPMPKGLLKPKLSLGKAEN